eukprot:GHVS01104215.1.p1 GENE.GHVS01104215.1~~GHVS01104215.1.p1  ORF type:complete len:180 (+),score=16.43 GHVS01104215.1:61-600(+)
MSVKDGESKIPDGLNKNNELNHGGCSENLLGDFALAKEVALMSKRFRVIVSKEEAEVQVEKKGKLLAFLDLPSFSPMSEKEFEGWVDLAARQVSKHRLCCRLFHEAWENAASETFAGLIGSTPACDDYEELVNSIAVKLFDDKAFVHEVEEELFNARRENSVVQAKVWITSTIARYVSY